MGSILFTFLCNILCSLFICSIDAIDVFPCSQLVSILFAPLQPKVVKNLPGSSLHASASTCSKVRFFPTQPTHSCTFPSPMSQKHLSTALLSQYSRSSAYARDSSWLLRLGLDMHDEHCGGIVLVHNGQPRPGVVRSAMLERASHASEVVQYCFALVSLSESMGGNVRDGRNTNRIK